LEFMGSAAGLAKAWLDQHRLGIEGRNKAVQAQLAATDTQIEKQHLEADRVRTRRAEQALKRAEFQAQMEKILAAKEAAEGAVPPNAAVAQDHLADLLTKLNVYGGRIAIVVHDVEDLNRTSEPES
jgi:hypothetical protein